MKKLILFLSILLISISCYSNPRYKKHRTAKPIKTLVVKIERKKLRHQNRIFQSYLQSSIPHKGNLSWSFRPKGQTLFYPLIKSKFN